MVREMYPNKEDSDRKIVFPGETIKLVECSQPILGGGCDLYTGFIDKKGNTVYVPNGTALSKKGILRRLSNKNVIHIQVEKGKNLNSCMDYHKDKVSFLGENNNPVPVEYGDKFSVLGFTINPFTD